jgi:hypothetical protein
VTGNSRSPVDPIERVNRGGARPRDFIEDYACFSFVSDLAEVEGTDRKDRARPSGRAV